MLTLKRITVSASHWAVGKSLFFLIFFLSNTHMVKNKNQNVSLPFLNSISQLISPEEATVINLLCKFNFMHAQAYFNVHVLGSLCIIVFSLNNIA